MKHMIFNTILFIAMLFVVGCTADTSGEFQNIPVTSDPNGATVTTGAGDSIITPGSFNLLRNQDHVLIAEYPGYEPMEKELKHKKQDWFWYKLVPERVHFKFIWLESTTTEENEKADANAPGNVVIGYRVREAEPGKFVKTPVYGEEPNEVPSAVQPSVEQEEFTAFDAGLQRHTWEIGGETYYFRYKEPRLMEDNGVFYGAVVGYTYRGWVPVLPEESFSEDKGLLKLEGRYASGQVDYDGALTDGTPYTMDNIDDYVIETRLLLGVEELDVDWLASLYTGIGYRYLNDDSSFDPYGYERESNYLYIPLGYQLDGSFRDNWSWGGRFEADFLVRGKQRSHLSNVGLLDVDNDQDKGYGLRGALRFRNKSENGILLIEPFIRYWDIDDSDISYAGAGQYGIEPANTTIECGIQLIWKF